MEQLLWKKYWNFSEKSFIKVTDQNVPLAMGNVLLIVQRIKPFCKTSGGSLNQEFFLH